MSERESTITLVKLEDMRIDPVVQRELKPGWAEKRVQIFSMSKVGILVTSLREDGFYYVLDGQNRAELMRKVGLAPETQVRCEVFVGLTKKEEAAIFLARNDKQNVDKIDKHGVATTEEDPATMALNASLGSVGLRIGKHPSEDSTQTSAVSTLHKLREAGTLDNALLVTTQAWGPKATDAHIYSGLGQLLKRNKDIVNIERLTEVLDAYGETMLLAKARATKETMSWPLTACIAHVIVERYNQGLRGKARLSSARRKSSGRKGGANKIMQPEQSQPEQVEMTIQ